MSRTVHDFTVLNAKGGAVALSEYGGQVLLIVNTASKCGFTPQYEGLQHLYEDYKERGFRVLAFPCNQFGRQEPGSDDQIQAFCSREYHVTFPVFARIEVNGRHAHPLYRHLKKQSRGFLTGAIKWNFTKFLVDRDGNVVGRYAPKTAPDEIRADIEALLEP